MARILAVVMALATTALAAQRTVGVLVPADKQALVGAVIGASPQLTTFAIACPSDTPSESCGFDSQTVTVLQGPSTWSYTYSFSNSLDGLYSQDTNCKLTPESNIASCNVVVQQQISGKMTTQSTSNINTAYSNSVIPVTITAGAEKLGPASPGATTAPGASNPAKTDGPKSNAVRAATSRNALLAGVIAVVGGVVLL